MGACRSVAALTGGPDLAVACGQPADPGSMAGMCAPHDGLWQQRWPSQYRAVLYPELYALADAGRLTVADGLFLSDGVRLVAGVQLLLRNHVDARYLTVVGGLVRVTDRGRQAAS